MSARDLEIRTCSNSLLAPGLCCQGMCRRPATKAVLLDDLTEHTWCDQHTTAAHQPLAVKPLKFNPVWGPT